MAEEIRQDLDQLQMRVEQLHTILAANKYAALSEEEILGMERQINAIYRLFWRIEGSLEVARA